MPERAAFVGADGLKACPRKSGNLLRFLKRRQNLGCADRLRRHRRECGTGHLRTVLVMRGWLSGGKRLPTSVRRCCVSGVNPLTPRRALAEAPGAIIPATTCSGDTPICWPI
jgi:hypothetical protein